MTVLAKKPDLSLGLDQQVELWKRVYQEVCGIELRLDDIDFPEDPGGFAWVVVVSPQVGLNDFYAGLRRSFKCWSVYGNDLEAALDWDKQERSYRGAYAARVRDREEADEELKSVSAEQIAGRGISTMTIDERIRLEGFFYTLSNGQHLDAQRITLCTGSRDSDGRVPGACWDPDGRKFYVGWSDPDFAGPGLRPRQVVS